MCHIGFIKATYSCQQIIPCPHISVMLILLYDSHDCFRRDPMTANPIDTYRRQIERELQAGNATEHTHRPALEDLIESLQPGATATNEPKRVECGAPDFIVSRKSVHGPMTLGYTEAKDVDKDLGEIEGSDQIKRY